MRKLLTLQEALAQSTSSPRRATVCLDGTLYHVTLNTDGSPRILVRRLDVDSSEPVETTAEALPEYGWVPGASLRTPEVSPAYWGSSSTGTAN